MAKKKAKKKRGRPTKYSQDFNQQVFKLALLGHTEAKIADFYSVNQSTLTRWKQRYKSFRTSLNAGREPADAEVAASLYQRALGYEHPETKVFCNDGQITTHEVVKHYPPDTAAAFIWLKNRAGWTDKREVGVSDETPQPATVEELREALAEAEAMLTEAHVIQLQVNNEVA